MKNALLFLSGIVLALNSLVPAWGAEMVGMYAALFASRSTEHQARF